MFVLRAMRSVCMVRGGFPSTPNYVIVTRGRCKIQRRWYRRFWKLIFEIHTSYLFRDLFSVRVRNVVQLIFKCPFAMKGKRWIFKQSFSEPNSSKPSNEKFKIDTLQLVSDYHRNGHFKIVFIPFLKYMTRLFYFFAYCGIANRLLQFLRIVSCVFYFCLLNILLFYC